MKDKFTLLYLCNRNATRSVALHYLTERSARQQGISGLEVFSRGIKEMQLEEADPFLIERLGKWKDMGNLRDHKPKQLKIEDLQRANLILYTERNHLDHVSYDVERKKAFHVNEFLERGVKNVEDPLKLLSQKSKGIISHLPLGVRMPIYRHIKLPIGDERAVGKLYLDFAHDMLEMSNQVVDKLIFEGLVK